MASGTAIEWTEATWNPVTGCDRVSPGCARCYALALAKRLKGMGQPKYQRDGDPKTSGPGFGVSLHEHALDEPLRWRRPRMVFVNSMSDLFHEQVPFSFIHNVFAVMYRAPQHTFQILTKRPERMLEWYRSERSGFIGGTERFDRDWPLPNVWLGVSIENARFSWRADVLREIPTAVRFVSAEPLLGSLFEEATAAQRRWGRDCSGAVVQGLIATGMDRSKRPLDLSGVDWLIAGGESGPNARALNLDWVRELRDACAGTGVFFFFKQVGGRTPKSGGRELDGRTWDEFPTAEGTREA